MVSTPNGCSASATATVIKDTAPPLLSAGGGIITCLSAKNGEAVWQQTFNDGFYASPILAGNHVYALDRVGVMHIFDADKTYTARGEAPLGEPSVSTPAFAGGLVLAIAGIVLLGISAFLVAAWVGAILFFGRQHAQRGMAYIGLLALQALFARFDAHVRKLAPPGVTLQVRDLHSAPPFMTDNAMVLGSSGESSM